MVRLILRYSHNITRIFTCTILESLFNESVDWGPILYDVRGSRLIEILENNSWQGPKTFNAFTFVY